MEKNDILNQILNYAQEKLQPVSFVPGKSSIPVTYPDIRAEDVVAISNTVLDIWWTEHKQAAEFERQLCSFLGFDHAVLCNSGSSANLLASTATFGQGKRNNKVGKFVITCATGFPTTVSPIYQNNLIPIYVDIDPYTLEPNYEQISYAMNHYGQDVAGCIIAHTLGFPYNEQLVSRLIGDDVWFVADSCDAFGSGFHAEYSPLSVGSYADAMTLSFFPAHHINCIEGGAILCQSEILMEKLESLKSWGRSCKCKPGQSNVCGKRFEWDERGKLPQGWDHKYIFSDVGYNFKMTDLQAALGVSQMKRASEIIWTRQNNFELMREQMRQIDPDLLRTVVVQPNVVPSPFGFPIVIDKDAPFDARELIAYLERYKIATRPVFGGNLIRQPGFMNKPYIHCGSLEGSDFVMNNVFWIGCGSFMTEEMIDYVFIVLENFLEEVA